MLFSKTRMQGIQRRTKVGLCRIAIGVCFFISLGTASGYGSTPAEDAANWARQLSICAGHLIPLDLPPLPHSSSASIRICIAMSVINRPAQGGALATFYPRTTNAVQSWNTIAVVGGRDAALFDVGSIGYADGTYSALLPTRPLLDQLNAANGKPREYIIRVAADMESNGHHIVSGSKLLRLSLHTSPSR